MSISIKTIGTRFFTWYKYYNNDGLNDRPYVRMSHCICVQE